MRIMGLIGFYVLLVCNAAAADLHSSVLYNLSYSLKKDLEDPRAEINKKAPAYDFNEGGATALWIAAAKGLEDMAIQLIDHHADLEIKSDNLQTTPLIEACWRGHEKVAILLIEKGANVNAIDKSGETALMGCAVHGLVEAMKLLLERGVDANVRNLFGFNALMFAVQRGEKEAFAMLLPVTFNVFAKSEDGRAAFDFAKHSELHALIVPRLETDRIWLALEELKQYMTPSELEKFVNDLLTDATT